VPFGGQLSRVFIDSVHVSHIAASNQSLGIVYSYHGCLQGSGKHFEHEIATSACRSSVLNDLVACIHGCRSQGIHDWLFTALQHQLYQQGKNKVGECIEPTCSMHVSSTKAQPHAVPGLMSCHMLGHAITVNYSKVNYGIARANMHSTACMQYSFCQVASQVGKLPVDAVDMILCAAITIPVFEAGLHVAWYELEG
jgi:hypothetical protein